MALPKDFRIPTSTVSEKTVLFQRVRTLALKTVRILLLVYIGFGAYLYFNQRNLLYYPGISDQRACAVFEKSGVERLTHGETVAFHKENGGTLVVLYHGNAGRACDRLFLSRFLDDLGVSYLFVEYAGFDDSRTPSKELLLGNVRDANAMLDRIPHQQLVLMGESLGTALAAYHATLRPPAKVVLLSPYTSIAEVASAHHPFYPTRLLVKDDFETDFGEENLEGSLLVVHGRVDGIIPFRLGEEVFRTAPFAEKRAVFPDGAGHNDLLDAPDVIESIADFIGSSKAE
jgi:pimeloyl-ACP methyl ester carboxylesterase